MQRVLCLTLFLTTGGCLSAAFARGASDWSQDTALSDATGARLGFNFARSVATDDDGGVHVVWSDRREGAPAIYYRRSLDDGGSFEPQLVRLSEGKEPAEEPAIAVAGESVYVAWHEMGGDSARVRLRRSLDRGASFGDVVDITALTPGAPAAHPSLAAEGDRLYVVWMDERDGHTEVYARRSTDGGTSFTPEERLTDLPDTSWVPSIAVSGQRVSLAWVDTRNGHEEEFFKRSTDGGATWGPDTPITDDRVNSWAPSIAADGDEVHLVWFSQKDSEYQPRDAEAKLDEALSLLGLPAAPAPAGVLVPDPNEEARRRCEAKMRLIADAAPSFVAHGGDGAKLKAILDAVEAMGHIQRATPAAEAKLDEARALLGLPTSSVPAPHTPELAMARVARIQATAPVWIAEGGDQRGLEAILEEFKAEARAVPPRDAEAKLDEARALLGLPATPDYDGDDLAGFQAHMEAKAKEVEAGAAAYAARGGDVAALRSRMEALGALLHPVMAPAAEAKLDEAEARLGLAPLASDTPEARMQAKLVEVMQAAPAWAAKGGDPAKLQGLMDAVMTLLGDGAPASYLAKERRLDEALALLGLVYTPGDLGALPQVYYLDAMKVRLADKLRQVQEAAPAWVAKGGDRKALEGILKEFEREMQLSTSEWEVYYRRSTDGGATFGPVVRLSHAPGASQRPQIARSGRELDVVWFDNRDGNFEIYGTRSTDGGARWEPEARLTEAPGDSLQPSLALSRGAVHVVWFDTRGGDSALYYKRRAR